jgi:hypothetical protein
MSLARPTPGDPERSDHVQRTSAVSTPKDQHFDVPGLGVRLHRFQAHLRPAGAGADADDGFSCSFDQSVSHRFIAPTGATVVPSTKLSLLLRFRPNGRARRAYSGARVTESAR